MKISIIIPVGNLDEWAVCEASLKASIAAYSGSVEAEVLPCYDLDHKGVYVARNEGLRRATGDWVAWVDCDDVVAREWFGEIAEAIERNANPLANSNAERQLVDVIQFDATEVKDGKMTTVKSFFEVDRS